MNTTVPSAHGEVVAAFRRAVEAGDAAGVLATLAPSITFINPIGARPFAGHDALAFLVPKVLDTWKNFRYLAELHGDGLVGLIFEAEVGSELACGIDLLRLNEQGLIEEITVMVRPLNALQALHAEMLPKLASTASN
jgi:hypothetical protein